jgi:thiol-disulfide isomerase/thioredoxin
MKTPAARKIARQAFCFEENFMSRTNKSVAFVTLLCPVFLPLIARGADAPRPAIAPAGRGSTLPAPGDVPTVPAIPVVPEGGSTLPVPPEASDPEIDANAEALITRASASYKALQSLSELIEVKADVPGQKPQVVRMRVYYQRPDKALVRMSDEVGTSTVAADGRMISLMMPQAKGKYMERALPEPVNPIEVVLQRTASFGPGLDLWLSGEDILGQMRPALSSLKIGAPEQIEGVAVESAVANLKSRGGVVTMTFSFGKEDHLLRRFRVERMLRTAEGKEVKLNVVELHREVQINAAIAPALLKFTPPAGYQKVDSLGPPGYDERLKVGVAPFPISAKDLGGKTLNLAQYKGKVVLLDFWATWCVTCMMEMPRLQAIYKNYKNQGFDIIGISADRTKADLQNVVNERGLGWRQVFDGPEGPIIKAYKIVPFPTSFLIGRDGKIAAINPHGPELEPAIKKALAQKATITKPAKSGTQIRTKTAKSAPQG